MNIELGEASAFVALYLKNGPFEIRVANELSPSAEAQVEQTWLYIVIFHVGDKFQRVRISYGPIYLR
jgi:hypothetical protein